jgi:hypothetical protein
MEQMEQTHNDNLSVEFYPSIEDQIHVARTLNSSVHANGSTVYLYKLFLVLNSIVFPAFLFFKDYIMVGLIVFATNVILVAFIVPRASAAYYRKYYSSLYGDRESKIARVDLTPKGISYTADEADSFWPWHRIKKIEETEESIYFYFDGSGFGVRKAGFAYLEEKNAFVELARRLQTSSIRQLSQ